MKRLELTLKAVSPEIAVFGVYCVAFLLVQYVTRPLQDLIAPTLVGTLLFLPHGVRVIGVWLFGVRAILPLIVGEALCIHFLGFLNLPLLPLLEGAVVGGVSCFLAFEIFRAAGHDFYLDSGGSRASWRMLTLLAGVGSVFNSLGHTIAYRDTFSFEDDLVQLLSFLIGDIGGTFVLLVGLVFFNRSLRRLKV